MVELILEWAKGDCKWNQVNHLYLSFEGNFCKNILRLVNLIRNIENMAIIINNISLVNKLNNFQEKLIRDIVSIDSLYIL